MTRLLRFIYLFCLLSLGLSAAAFSLESYAPNSALSEGKWVKISVEESGMHCIPSATLRSWGFTDPARVRVHGYGGRMLSDFLTEADYLDDLPRVASQVTARGLVFYAVGPMQIDMTGSRELSHSVNPYSSYGYYFLTQGDAPTDTIPEGGTPVENPANCATSTGALLVHDVDLFNLGSSGRQFLGEEFRTTRTRKFAVNLTDRVEGSTWAKITTNFVANSTSASMIKHIIDSTELPYKATDRIAATGNDSGYWGSQSVTTKNFEHSGPTMELALTYSASGTVKNAALDYFEITYEKALGNSGEFLSASPALASPGARGGKAHIWDVTSIKDGYYALRVDPTSGGWRNERAGVRRYVQWSETDAMPAPKRVGSVAGQNLHAEVDNPDMIIIAPDRYMAAARDIADLHHGYPLDSLRVQAVRLDEVLNEFGSGAFDPGAIRRYLKMVYDRGVAAGRPLKYALLIGKGTFDNRRLTGIGRMFDSPMPLWISENSLNNTQSFTTDDYFGMLDDNSGQRPGRDPLTIAVGRIPATNVGEATTAVEKIRQYMYSMPSGHWRHRVTILADDENSGQHMLQSERMVKGLEAGAVGRHMLVDKIYCDAYPRVSGSYPQAREELFSDFADGISLFAFVGHGSPTALGSKMMIGPLDFQQRFHLRRLPFFYAATCSFLEWDNDIKSQAEALMFQDDGGLIGCISAVRPVYITNNGTLTAAFGDALGAPTESGAPLTVGELYRQAKNRVSNDTNKLRYVLMSDPALSLVFPEARVTLDAINGVAVTEAEPFTAMARQRLTLKGRVTGADGNLLTDFSGTVTATLYDAEQSTTSHGYGDGEEVTFEQKGALLFQAAGKAEGGEYTIEVQMPATIADNFRPTTLSLYAAPADANDLRHAAGIERNLYAFGYDESTPADVNPPTIHSMGLNGEEFAEGSRVNPDPLLIARVSDDSGINLSTAGIGQRMSLSVDGRENFSDLATYFTPDTEASSGKMSGTLAYPLSGLKEGTHTLRLRVWDIDGNFADRELACEVVNGLAPEVYEVFTDAMPARDQARFYVRHNRPEQILKVRVSVYNLLGQPVWSGETETRSNMNVSAPVVWDLRDSSGKRVGRGIYVYRAEVTGDGSEAVTKSKKIAVAAQ